MASAPSPSPLRWLRFPILVTLLPCIASGLLFLSQTVEGMHDAIMPLMMATQLLVVLAFLLILLWWTFFSGVRWAPRLLGLFLAVGASAGFVGSARKVEFVHSRFLGLAPRFEFKWQPTNDDLLNAHRSKQADDQQPDIDLAIRSDDFPRYRGVNVDGVAKIAAFSTDWEKSSPKELYKQSSRAAAGTRASPSRGTSPSPPSSAATRKWWSATTAPPAANAGSTSTPPTTRT